MLPSSRRPPASPSPPRSPALEGQIVERETPFAFSGRIDQVLSAANTLNLELASNRLRSTGVGDGLTRTTATKAHTGALGGQSLFGRSHNSAQATVVNQLFLAWSPAATP